jgi:26S proteasome regulatory subunit N11
MVVGWYHSHPGFGCWLSGVDINTQQSFEALSERAVAVVVDPIQSVKGKVRLLGKAHSLCLGHQWPIGYSGLPQITLGSDSVIDFCITSC